MRVKRPLCVVSAAVVLSVLPVFVRSAPLSDVGSNNWAYRPIASLAARGIINGYPDGRFHGDRLATRKEMAALISRTLSQAEAEAAPRSDLTKTGQLIDALKDELDALSIRVSRLEERSATPQAENFAPQPAVRRASQRAAALTQAAFPREMVETQRDSAVFLTRVEMATLSAGAMHELESRDVSKSDLQKAHRTITDLSDRLDALSSRIARFDGAAGSEKSLQPMMRISRGNRAAGVVDAVSLSWVRLDEPVEGTVAGISFHLLGASSSVRYGLIGQAVFGLRATSLPSPTIALQTLVTPQTSLSPSGYAPRTSMSFRYSSPFGASVVTRDLTAPEYNDLLKNSIGAALTPSAPIGTTQQLATPNADLSLPAGDDRAASFSVPTLGFSAFGPNVYPQTSLNVPQLRVNLTIPSRIGAAPTRGTFGLAHLQGLDRSASASSCTILPALCAAAFGSDSFDNQLLASTTFDVRALGRHVSLNVGGGYEQLHRPAGTALPYVPYDPAADSRDSTLMNFSPVTFDPNYVDVLRRTLNAAAAMPLSRDLTLNLQYDKEYYTGSYQSLGQSIDERRDSYLGNLTYTFPSTSNTLVLSAKQYRYRDAFLPTYNQTQNRADLNFTIKF